jgi:hypothetical protein
MRATDCLSTCLGKPEVLHLARLNQILYRSRNIFDGHIWVYGVLVEQVNNIDLEPLERFLGCLFDVIRLAVQATEIHSRDRIKIEPELRSDYHLLTERSKRFAHKFFIHRPPIYFSGVKEGDAAFHGRTYKRDHLLPVWNWIKGTAHSHAAEPESRNFQAAVSKCTLLHLLNSCL